MSQRTPPFTLLGEPGEQSSLGAPDGFGMTLMPPGKQALWDHFITTSPACHFLQGWAWGEVKRAFGWEPLRIALWDASFQHVLAVAQILLRPIPLTGYAFAYLPKGPVIDWDNAALCEHFFTALHPLLSARRIAFLRLEPDLPAKMYLPPSERSEAVAAVSPGEAEAPLGGRYRVAQGRVVARQLEELGFLPIRDRAQPLRTIVVDLRPDEATIARRQTRSRRYNANLAARKGVTIRAACSLDDVYRWYHLLEITRKRNRFVGHPFSYYRRVWEELGAANQVQLFLAEHAGKLLAGAFVTLVGRQSTYLYGASSNEERNLKPNDLLQREAMRWARAQGAAFYDLWGIAETDDPADPQAGYSSFKQGWGGQVIEYMGSFDYVYVPAAYQAFLAGKRLVNLLMTARAALRRRRGPSKGAMSS